MKNLFLCSYFAGVKDTFKDFMNNDTKGKKVLFIPTANIDEETKFLVDEAKEVENLGANYVVAGHIFETECKKGLEPRGLKFIKDLSISPNFIAPTL